MSVGAAAALGVVLFLVDRLDPNAAVLAVLYAVPLLVGWFGGPWAVVFLPVAALGGLVVGDLVGLLTVDADSIPIIPFMTLLAAIAGVIRWRVGSVGGGNAAS